jgi:hypothetical protein
MMPLRLATLVRANKLSAVAIVLLCAFAMLTMVSVFINPWPSERTPARLRAWIDFDGPTLIVAWAKFSRPEIGPEVVFDNSAGLMDERSLLNARDQAFAVWNQRHPLVRVRLFKVLVVGHSPIIQRRANHYVWVGTSFGLGVSYWLVLALVLLAQIPWVMKVAKRQKQGFPVHPYKNGGLE